MSLYQVKWLGDPGYGGIDNYDEVHNALEIEASCAISAARKAFCQWCEDDRDMHGPGTQIGVRLTTAVPPVQRFEVDDDDRVRWAR